MPVFLEIARAACLSVARRLGLWFLGLGVVAAIAVVAEPELAQVLVGIGLFALVGAAVPIAVGTGLRRWLRAGPLGLAARGAGYWATFGYGLGAALVALPFVLVGVRALEGRLEAQDLAAGGCAVLMAAWLGAAAGRLVDSGLAIAMLSWMGAAAVLGATLIVSMVARDNLFAALSGVLGAQLADVAVLGATALGSTHLLMLGAAYADQRAPTRREP